MRFFTSFLVFAATISALPIANTDIPATAEITPLNAADAADNNSVTANIAASADTKDAPWGYGPPNGGYNYNYNSNSRPGYATSYGPPPRPNEPQRAGSVFESVGYGVGSVVGTPIGWLGDLVGGAGSGLYNGLKGGYRRVKG